MKLRLIKYGGENVELGKLNVLNSPYPEFEWLMQLYGKINILLAYDRSALDIGIPHNDKYVLMSEFTNKPFIRGMKSTLPINMLNNFQLLDEIVKLILN